MTAEYREWQFNTNRQSQPAADIKIVNALEYCALYLSRIDRHLERIADAAEKAQSPPSEKG